jgi:glutamine synthetase
MLWSVTLPGLAETTAVSLEYDQRSNVGRVSVQWVDVEGFQRTAEVPIAGDQLQRLISVAAGWPFR